MQIKIIRHSERLDYTHPLYWLVCFGQYWADSPLTTNGHKIAKLKGIELKNNNFDPKHIYTSPYNRTMSTATEIKNSFPQSKIVIEPLLAEYQPMFKHQISLYPEGIPTTFDGCETDFKFPETYDNFTSRIHFVIQKLISKSDSDIIIITHGEVLKTFINNLQNKYPDQLLDPGTTPYLTTLSFEYDKITNMIVDSSIKIN